MHPIKPALFTVVLIATNISAAPPDPVKSEYLLTTGGAFVIKDSKIFYGMNYRVIGELPVGYHLEVSFENPRRLSPFIADTRRLTIDGDEILVQSPDLECIDNGRNYQIRVDIFTDETKSRKLGSHTQKIEFRMDEDLLKKAAVARCH